MLLLANTECVYRGTCMYSGSKEISQKNGLAILLGFLFVDSTNVQRIRMVAWSEFKYAGESD